MTNAGPPRDATLKLLAADADQRVFGPGLAWWRSHVDRTGRLPSRADLSPEDLTVSALPHVLLVDIGPAVNRLRFRLVGTAHVAFNRRDFTGLEFDEVYPSDSPILAYVKGLYRDLVEARRPLWTVNQVPHPRTGEALIMRRLMMPLSSDGEIVNLSLGIQTIEQRPSEERDSVNPWHSASVSGERGREVL